MKVANYLITMSAALSATAQAESATSPIDAFYKPKGGHALIEGEIGSGSQKTKTTGNIQGIDLSSDTKTTSKDIGVNARVGITDAWEITASQKYEETKGDEDKVSGLNNPSVGVHYGALNGNIFYDLGLEAEANAGSESIKTNSTTYSMIGSVGYKTGPVRLKALAAYNHSTDDNTEDSNLFGASAQWFLAPTHALQVNAGTQKLQSKDTDSDKMDVEVKGYGIDYKWLMTPSTYLGAGVAVTQARADVILLGSNITSDLTGTNYTIAIGHHF